MPVEERKFKEKAEQGFGEQQEQSKICQEIMNKTGVWIEMSSAKDKSLTVVITGKCENVMKARKMVVQQLQTQVRIHSMLWTHFSAYCMPRFCVFSASLLSLHPRISQH